ncbi:hypothetical protein ACWEQ4_00880 [Rhodococcus sp. NPDC003994]
MTQPCTLNPDAWQQHGDDPDWAATTPAVFARKQCRNSCPAADFAACALSALTTAGSLEAETKRVRVAAGVIMAGVACNGDEATRQALLPLAYPDGIPTHMIPRPDDIACTNCDREFIPDDEPITLGANVAHRATNSHSLCRGCYSAEWRSGTLTPAVRTIIPDDCITCHRPMTRRSNPAPGRVIHESRGNCTACARAAARIAKAAG